MEVFEKLGSTSGEIAMRAGPGSWPRGLLSLSGVVRSWGTESQERDVTRYRYINRKASVLSPVGNMTAAQPSVR